MFTCGFLPWFKNVARLRSQGHFRITFSLLFKASPGARFSKVPKTFWTRKAIRKTTTCLFCKAGFFKWNVWIVELSGWLPNGTFEFNNWMFELTNLMFEFNDCEFRLQDRLLELKLWIQQQQVWILAGMVTHRSQPSMLVILIGSISIDQKWFLETSEYYRWKPTFRHHDTILKAKWVSVAKIWFL